VPFKGVLAQPTRTEAELAQNAATVFQMLTGHWVAQIVRAAAELRIADHLASNARTAEDIASAEASDVGATFRLLRACASLGLLAHDGHQRFSLTPLGTLLRSGVPRSVRELALAQGSHGIWQSWGLFPEAVRAGETQVERALGSDLFQYFARTPDEAALFSKAMSNSTGLVVEDAVALLDLSAASQVVDVGGADGALLLALMQSHLHIGGVVLDLPHVVSGAQEAAVEAGLADRFSSVAGDFFESVPEADYYILKWILHMLTDEQCLTVLRCCRTSARAGARLLIIEALIGEIGKPDPAAISDMMMLTATRGQERSIDEYDALFEASGWRRTAVSPTRSHYSLVELEAA